MLVVAAFLAFIAFAFFGLRRKKINTWSGYGKPGSTQFIPLEDDRSSLDPSIFRDDVALSCDWTLMFKKDEGGTGCSHRLRRDSGLTNSRLQFTESFDLYFDACLFLIPGAALLSLILLAALANKNLSPLFYFCGSLPGLSFIAIGLFTVLNAKKSNVRFDLDRQMMSTNQRTISLRSVHALQLLSARHRVRVSGRRLFSLQYEMNLVNKDGSRIRVISHAGMQALRADAAVLASLLNIRLWDAIDYC